MKNEISVTELAYELNVHYGTIDYWYKWQRLIAGTEKFEKLKNSGMPILPKFKRINNNPRGKRLWEKEDIKKIKEFKNWVENDGRGNLIEITKNTNYKFYENRKNIDKK